MNKKYLYLLMFLICFVFSIDVIHFSITKKIAYASVVKFEKKYSNNNIYVTIQYLNNNEKKIIKKKIKNKFYQLIKNEKKVNIYYRNIFKNEVYFVKKAPSFVGQFTILFITSLMFLMGFIFEKKQNNNLN